MAPLLGITQRSFRYVFHKHYPGFDCALAPFLSTTTGNPPLAKRFRDLFPGPGINLATEPQLLGKDGQDFAQCAQRLCDDWGYQQVNWNIGCPSPTVTSRLRGAGLLSHPDQIDCFLDKAFSSFQGTISLKMRLGMQDPEEWQALSPILNRYPLQNITIHPRTGRQAYTGQADVAGFAALAASLEAPIIYNGDIRTKDFGLALLRRFPKLQGLMLGRGALANPELPAQIQAALQLAPKPNAPLAPDLAPWPSPRPEIDAQRFKAFHDELIEAYLQEESQNNNRHHSGQLVMSRLKELWPYWTPLLGMRGDRLCAKILRSRQLDEFLKNSALAIDALNAP